MSIWCIGEYGEFLTRPLAALDADTPSFTAIAGTEVASMLDRCLRLHNPDNYLKCLILSSLIKLSVRVGNDVKGLIGDIVAPYRSSISLELQQRSSEFCLLLGNR